ncbi:MAG: DUF2073 domain-containing protein [Theionarchaea archaeon]|nr:DUF2073 domain-containing protein [Theionarchaea archaeon]
MKLEVDFLPFSSIKRKPPEEKVEFLMERVKAGKVIVIEGTLDPEEEAMLIESTMKAVSEDFPGIELCTLSGDEYRKLGMLDDIRDRILKTLGHRKGIVVIGPAAVIKEVKRSPGILSMHVETE